MKRFTLIIDTFLAHSFGRPRMQVTDLSCSKYVSIWLCGLLNAYTINVVSQRLYHLPQHLVPFVYELWTFDPWLQQSKRMNMVDGH